MVGELLPCARKKLESAVSELCRARGRGQGGELLKLIEGGPPQRASRPIPGPRYGGSASVLPSSKSDQEISKLDFYQTIFLPKIRPKADLNSLF